MGCTTTEYTQQQFDAMADILRNALDAGFLGLSTGLEFFPGVICRPEEIERLAAIVAEYDGNYSSHMRDEGNYLFETIDEFLNVIRKTGFAARYRILKLNTITAYLMITCLKVCKW